MRRSAFSSFRMRHLFLVLPLTILLSGCAGHTPFHYYTLKPVSGVEAMTTSHSIGIQPVIMPAWLEQNKISWNDGGVNLMILEQDRWAGPLSKMINQTMLRSFSRIYPEARVSLGPWVRSATPDRVISTQIMALERTGNLLSTEIIITVSDQQREVLSNRFKTYHQPLADNASAGEFAEALGEILGRMNIEIASALGG